MNFIRKFTENFPQSNAYPNTVFFSSQNLFSLSTEEDDLREMPIFGIGLSSLFGLGRKEGDDSGGEDRRGHVVDDRLGVPEEKESASDEEEEEEDVVVEDGQVGGLEISDFVRFPQNSLVFFLLRHLLVVRQRAQHVHSHGGFATSGDAVLENVLGLFVGKGNQGRGKQSGDSKNDSSFDVSWIHLVDTPVQPNRQCRNDECISVKQRCCFGRQGPAKVL